MRIARRLTIMVLLGHGEPVRSFHVSRRSVVLGALSILFLFLTTTGGVGYTLRRHARNAELRALESRNMALMGEVSRLEVVLANFQGTVARQVERENTLRQLANLDPLDPDVWKVGVGGRNGTNRLSVLEAPERTRVAALAGGVDELLRKAELQQESYREIETALLQRRARLDATPSITPVVGCRVTAGFGRRPDPFTGDIRMHTGVDFSAPNGAPVLATAAGVVRHASRYENYGNCVEIDHGQGVVTRYAHNSALKVRVGQKVSRGDVIALVGSSGRATAPHCHYEVLLNGRPVDPDQYILPRGAVYD